MITAKEVEEIKKISGKSRTAGLRTDAAYVTKYKGQGALKKVEERMRGYGYPVNYEKTKSLDWCPMSMRVLSLLVIKDEFNWSDSDVRAMGYAAPVYSFVARLFMKTIGSPKLAISRAPVYWASNYDIGRVEVEYPCEGQVSLIVKDFKVHPMICRHIEGYLERVIQYVVPEKKVTLSETKCIFKGDPYHQFDASW